MAKSFKEIGKKAEALIEQGNEAERKVQSCQGRVVSANSRVAMARAQLAAARETDEEGNPKGDVQQAQAQLSMAQNQLAASQRALSAAKSDVARVNQEKQSHVQTIEQHNRVERSNLQKLQRIRGSAFSHDSAAITKGMAERLNSAEDSRVALLRSMGIEASAEYVPVNEDGTNGNLWTAGGFSALDLSGEIQSYQGGNSEGLPSDGVVASPIGGGLTSAVTSGGISIGDARKTQSVESDQDNDPNNPHSIVSQGIIGSEFPSSGNLQEAYGALVTRIIESRVLSVEQKLSELNMLRNQLLAVAQNYSNQVEADAIKENVKVLKLSAAEKRQMGERYINNIIEVYRDIAVQIATRSHIKGCDNWFCT